MARTLNLQAYRVKQKKKNPGVHCLSRHTNQKSGKYYAGSKYRGQGR